MQRRSGVLAKRQSGGRRSVALLRLRARRLVVIGSTRSLLRSSLLPSCVLRLLDLPHLVRLPSRRFALSSSRRRLVLPD
jgi:hypothetical protein